MSPEKRLQDYERAAWRALADGRYHAFGEYVSVWVAINAHSIAPVPNPWAELSEIAQTFVDAAKGEADGKPA